MKLACKTDIGNQRTENQDNYRAARQPDETVWALVCDGMGGARGGKLAASIAAEYVENAFSQQLAAMQSPKELRQLLLHAIEGANEKIYKLSQSDAAMNGMGTTIVCAIVQNGFAHYAHVGDSRIYFYRAGKLVQITKDHSIVQELVEHGTITEREAITHPRKNLITRALGVAATVLVDYAKARVYDGDIMLLCSDGLTNCVSSEEIVNILKSTSFFNMPDLLIKRALANGGQDNITAALIQIEQTEAQHG